MTSPRERPASGIATSIEGGKPEVVRSLEERVSALEEQVAELQAAAAQPVKRQRVPQDIRRGAEWITQERAKVERRVSRRRGRG